MRNIIPQRIKSRCQTRLDQQSVARSPVLKPVRRRSRCFCRQHCTQPSRSWAIAQSTPKTQIAATRRSGAGGSLDADLWPAAAHPSFLDRVLSGIAKHGAAAFFTYITISNVASCTLLAVGMVLFVQTTGCSPVAAGQWPKFAAFYAGVWGINQSTRSARLAVTALLTPAADVLIGDLAAQFGWKKTRTVLLLFVLEAVLLLTALAVTLAICCSGLKHMVA